MTINYNLVIVVMLFIVLMSIQFTLNKIYVLLKEIKEIYPDKNIWCYTGYTYEKDLMQGGKVHTSFTEEMLSYIDILVDGRFIEAQKDITLKFRGSANQRILNLR